MAGMHMASAARLVFTVKLSDKFQGEGPLNVSMGITTLGDCSLPVGAVYVTALHATTISAY